MISRANDTLWRPGERPRSRFAVGLTGGIGSGKSTVADLFALRGAAVIDTDVIAHGLTAANGPAMPAVRTAFGDAVVQEDGAMNRVAMRALVFAEPSARHRLEAILHPMIREKAEEAASQAQGVYLLFVVPLLVESGSWRTRVSRVLVVDCEEEEQVRRVMRRSGLVREQVESILAAQASRAQRLAVADDVVVNRFDLAALEPQVERLHALYLSLAQAV